jgi:hypothetical protein
MKKFTKSSLVLSDATRIFQSFFARHSNWVLFSTFLMMFSCNINPGFEEVKTSRIEPLDDRSLILKGPVFLTSTSSLDRVDLITHVGSSLTGTVTVEIRNADGSVVIGSTTVPAGSILTGMTTNTFLFSPALVLNADEKYRIYVTRSDVHNYSGNNYIFWRTSSGGVDAYPAGINDVHPSWTLDYAFTTYNGGIVDQQQTLATYGFFVGSGFYRWQEFVPSVPKVNLTYAELNLTVGSATTGTITVEIRSADGATVLSSHSMSATSLPVGTNWVKFKPGVTLIRDQPYRIYVTRSDAHNYPMNNYIFWRTSSGGTNAYPDGINDVHPAWTLDYAFRTYSSISGLDQQQNLNTYGFFLGNTFHRWQEFVPRNP